MAKFFGAVGYALTAETEPGIWEEKFTERDYYGDVLRDSRRLSSSAGVNGEVNISSRISILSDPFACEHFHAIRYVRYMGANWTVTEAEVIYPRIILTLGGVYNGQTTAITGSP